MASEVVYLGEIEYCFFETIEKTRLEGGRSLTERLYCAMAEQKRYSFTSWYTTYC